MPGILLDDPKKFEEISKKVALDGSNYENLRHFFYSAAWSLDVLRHRWYAIVRDSGLVYTVNGRVVLAGDGVKASKEARYMPGVKKMVQESEDSSKGEFIFGHMFGAVGVLLGDAQLCCPLKFNIQEGLRSVANWKDSFVSGESHALQMVNNLFEAARVFGKSYALLDRYFLCAPLLIRLRQLNEASGHHAENILEIVTKAKSNAVAYTKPQKTDVRRRGRPRLKGEAVHLKDLWNSKRCFRRAAVHIYGREETVRYRFLPNE